LSTTPEYVAELEGGAGVHSLDHFSLTVPDLGEAEIFFSAFGLDVQRRSGRLEIYAFDSGQRWVIVSEGGKKAIGHITLGAYPDDLPELHQRLVDTGVVLLQSSGWADGLWFRDPCGLLVEVRAADKSSPTGRASVAEPPALSSLRGAPLRGETAAIRPRRLSHILLFTPDIGRSVAFYSKVLGLRLSDSAGPVAFLHGRHGSDHHLLAFAESSRGIGYHHSAWEVGSISEVGLGAMQMAERGYARGWGLGRHVLGSNYFHYVRDPWGSYSEFSCGIDYIPAGLLWTASRPDPQNSLYLWGPPPPEDFTENYEL
jgi:catechol 2,3-dioxygenase